MRTKKLLLMAAVGLVATATSFAQIYSVNAVGYVNVTIPADGVKLALLANPLDGTNNHLNTILPLDMNAAGTTLFLWDEAAQNWNPAAWFGTEWMSLGDPSFPLVVPPGVGFFIQGVDLSGAGVLNITFVGEVRQGHLVNPLPANPLLGLKASMVPQAGGLETQLGFPAGAGDTIFKWNVATQSYEAYACLGPGMWLNINTGQFEEPGLQVAEGFFLQRAGTTPIDWVRDFSVNP